MYAICPDGFCLSESLLYNHYTVSQCFLDFSRRFPYRGGALYQCYSPNEKHWIFLKHYDFNKIKKLLTVFNGLKSDESLNTSRPQAYQRDAAGSE